MISSHTIGSFFCTSPCREIQQWLPAARTYGIAAKAYGRLEDSSNEAVSLCRQAACLCQGRRKKDSAQVADECMILTQKVNNDIVLGKPPQSFELFGHAKHGLAKCCILKSTYELLRNMDFYHKCLVKILKMLSSAKRDFT